MTVESERHVKKMSPNEIHKFLKKHEDPGVTTSEVASAFDVTTRAALYRLEQLEEEGRVQGKKVGASGKIWFPVG